VGKEGAIQLAIASKAVEGLKMLAEHSGNKLVIVPNDFKGMIKLVGLDSKQ
jgi:hypothetical protein